MRVVPFFLVMVSTFLYLFPVHALDYAPVTDQQIYSELQAAHCADRANSVVQKYFSGNSEHLAGWINRIGTRRLENLSENSARACLRGLGFTEAQIEYMAETLQGKMAPIGVIQKFVTVLLVLSTSSIFSLPYLIDHKTPPGLNIAAGVFMASLLFSALWFQLRETDKSFESDYLSGIGGSRGVKARCLVSLAQLIDSGSH